MPQAMGRFLPKSVFPTQEHLDYIWTDWLEPGHIRPDALDQRLEPVYKDLVMVHKELVELPFDQFKGAFLQLVCDRGLANQVSRRRKKGPRMLYNMMRVRQH
jgi:hypothetical protein